MDHNNMQHKKLDPTMSFINRDDRPMEILFKELLPDSLFMSHYELSNTFPMHTQQQWRKFLQENDKFILRETALITEASARKALQRLSVTGEVKSSADTSAITQLLKASEQINQQTKDQTVYTTVFMPDPNDLEYKDLDQATIYATNREKLGKFYPIDVLDHRQQKEEIFLNLDGTMHVIAPVTGAMNTIDKIYLSLFNPENKKVEKRSEVEREWQ